MKQIQLVGGLTATVDDDDYEMLSGFRWQVNHNGYAIVRLTLMMHRLVMNTPEGMVTDHIDGDPLNNCKANLRVCTRAENNRNVARRPGGHSKYKGVTWYAGKGSHGLWKAYIAGKHIGYFRYEIEAALAYDA